jgi:hypothetical protein
MCCLGVGRRERSSRYSARRRCGRLLDARASSEGPEEVGEKRPVGSHCYDIWGWVMSTDQLLSIWRSDGGFHGRVSNDWLMARRVNEV